MGKILCWLGLHSWGKWMHRVVNYGYYDEEHWYEKRCTRSGCKAVQTKE